MKSVKTRVVLSVGFVALTLQVLVASSSHAQGGIAGYPDSVQAYDPREVAPLPRYCKSTQLFRNHFHTDESEVAHWYQVLGPTFNALHHYCWAMMETNRALVLAKTKQFRDFYLTAAIGDIDYVLERAPPDFVLLPEILTKKGENLLALGRTGPGLEALEKAIRAKPDYWPPYAAISDRFKQSGDPRSAREWLEKGLAAAPNTPALKRRLQALQGEKK
jgi:tetratricopeptide (TPR) repeat protein